MSSNPQDSAARETDPFSRSARLQASRQKASLCWRRVSPVNFRCSLFRWSGFWASRPQRTSILSWNEEGAAAISWNFAMMEGSGVSSRGKNPRARNSTSRMASACDAARKRDSIEDGSGNRPSAVISFRIRDDSACAKLTMRAFGLDCMRTSIAKQTGRRLGCSRTE